MFLFFNPGLAVSKNKFVEMFTHFFEDVWSLYPGIICIIPMNFRVNEWVYICHRSTWNWKDRCFKRLNDADPMEKTWRMNPIILKYGIWNRSDCILILRSMSANFKKLYQRSLPVFENEKIVLESFPENRIDIMGWMVRNNDPKIHQPSRDFSANRRCLYGILKSTVYQQQKTVFARV